MTPRVEQRFLRLIASAVLDSDLSLREVAEVGRALQTSPALAIRLGDMMAHIVAFAGEASSQPAQAQLPILPADENVRPSPALLLRAISKRRMSKRMAIDLLQRFDTSRRWTPDRAATTSKLAASFVASVPPADAMRAIAAITDGESADPFLSGILKREQE